MIKKILLTFICFLLVSNSSAQTWKNPITLEGEWSAYGIGDPYVLKYRGLFYLYCSTKDAETGVKCWSSKDLVNWTNEGLCSTDPITKGAYAPEVIYWNGVFYMYTSPRGDGHYVLSSTSPRGPFTPITNNYGKWIDGSVFIDDNAKAYFYHASPSGILGCSMANPYSFGESQNLNAQMNRAWTEGPCVFKRNDKYYLIYTGNHLISKGYRIDYAVNSTGPISQYSPVEGQNPILLNTMGSHVGLGHGSIFVGPDLDSYYLTYHNLVSPNGPQRHLNFDRIAWNGEKMILLGSTDFEQEAMALPDEYDYFDRADIGEGWNFPSGGKWHIINGEYLSQDTTIADNDNWFMALMTIENRDNYTAEFNFKETLRENSNSKLGIVFDYVDDSDYGTVLFNSSANQMELNFIENNNWGVKEIIDLPGNQDFSNWHSARIEKFNSKYKIFLDNMLIHSVERLKTPGAIGYLTDHCHGDFSFIAFSNKVNGSGVFDVYKPIPGTIDALLFNEGGEGESFHEESPVGSVEKILRQDENEIIESSLGGYAISTFETNEWYKYNVNIESEEFYNCEIIYASDESTGKIQISIDDVPVSDVIELSSTGGTNIWQSHLIKDLSLPKGFHTMKIEAISGKIDLYSMKFVLADNVSFEKTVDFNFSFGAGWKYYDGDWSIKDNAADIKGYGKRAFGSSSWRDYVVDTDIRFSRSMNAGIIFRVNNPALGGAGNDPALGTDFLQGYFAGFNFSSIVLGKHNYNWESLVTASGSFTMNTWYHMRVKVIDDNIRIYIDDMVNPLINYTDPMPLTNGMAGLRSHNTDAQFDNFKVTTDTITSINDHASILDNNIHLYPNPAREYLNIDFKSACSREVRILNISGEVVLRIQIYDDHVMLPVKLLKAGLYIIQIQDNEKVYAQKLLIS